MEELFNDAQRKGLIQFSKPWLIKAIEQKHSRITISLAHSQELFIKPKFNNLVVYIATKEVNYN